METVQKWEAYVPVPGKPQPSPEPDRPDLEQPVPGEIPPEPIDKHLLK
jgi:hypothetical protein